MAKKIIDLVYLTPKDNRKTALMRYGEWIEVYPREVIYAHKTNQDELKKMGLVPTEKVPVFKTQKEALKASKTNKLKFTE